MDCDSQRQGQHGQLGFSPALSIDIERSRYSQGTPSGPQMLQLPLFRYQGPIQSTHELSPSQRRKVDLSEGLREYGVSQSDTAGATVSGSAVVTQQYCNVPYQALSESMTDWASDLADLLDATEEPEFAQAARLGSHKHREPEWYNQVYYQYQQLLRETNTNTSRSRVLESRGSLREMSNLLLRNASSLSKSSIP